MKAFVLTDLEGAAGVVSFEEQTYASGKYFDEAKALATGEVNAAVEALMEFGVADILVVDGHGPGGLCYEQLHPAARLLHGRPLPQGVIKSQLERGYDIALIIGQHAMAGVPDGNLSHTQSSRLIEAYSLNQRPIGELAQFALLAGTFGVPLIFLSGDEAACREAEEFVPGITTVSVKEGLSLHSAISVSPKVARERIAAGVARALVRHQDQPVAPLRWPGPYVLDKVFRNAADAEADSKVPRGAERIEGRTLRFRSGDIAEIIYS